MTTAEANGETLQIQVKDIRPSPTNPRKTFVLDDLLASLPTKQIQPIGVRLLPDQATDYELVYGERRWRAARELGWETIRAEVLDLTDQQVEEIQIIENVGRQDLSPVEEADGYQALMSRHRLSVAEICARTGKADTYVRQRVALCRLTERGKDALRAGLILMGAALLLVTINSAKQDDALTEITFQRTADDPMPIREVRYIVQAKYHLVLATAPFPTDDATLTQAGPCGTCPKRSSAQLSIIAAPTDADDKCTDATCFQAKADATWQRKKDWAAAHGVRVVEDEEAKKLMRYGAVAPDAGLVDLDAREDGKTWRERLGASVVPTCVVRDGLGRIHELVDARVARESEDAEEESFDGAEECESDSYGTTHEPVLTPSPRARKKSDYLADRQAELAERQKTMGLIARGAERDNCGAPFWQLLIRAGGFTSSESDAVLTSRGYQTKSKGADALVEYATACDDANMLRGLYVELVCERNGTALHAFKEYYSKEPEETSTEPTVQADVERVYQAVADGAATRAEIVKQSGVADPTKAIKDLLAANRIEKTGERKATRYAVKRHVTAEEEAQEARHREARIEDEARHEASQGETIDPEPVDDVPATTHSGCRVCGCFDAAPCAGVDGIGCGWAERDLCTVCQALQGAILEEVGTKRGGVDALKSWLAETNADSADFTHERGHAAINDLVRSGQLRLRAREVWRPEVTA